MLVPSTMVFNLVRLNASLVTLSTPLIRPKAPVREHQLMAFIHILTTEKQHGMVWIGVIFRQGGGLQWMSSGDLFSALLFCDL